MISATRSVDFLDHNMLSSSNKKSIIIVNHPHKIASDQQYMVDFHDVSSCPNLVHNGCENDIILFLSILYYRFVINFNERDT